jgi:hypothetical protein
MMVPILSLNVIKNEIANESFIYSVPIYTESGNPRGPEIDLVAMSDGEFLIGECKKPNNLENKVFSKYGDIAKQIMCNRILFSTVTREHTCENQDCTQCQTLGDNYSDEIFTHGESTSPEQWGTREKIKNFRAEMSREGITVETLCAYNLGLS